MPLVESFPQHSEEWHEARCGLPTTSNFDKIITTKGEPSKQRKAYLHRLAGERVTRYSEETFQSQAMLKGLEMEEEAINLYEMIKSVDIQRVGVVYKNEEKKYLTSPDALVGDKGLLEVKCPIMHTAVGYLLNGDVATTYFQQLQGQLFVTGREWVDFFSYYPGLRTLIVRIEPDKKFLALLEPMLGEFCKELDVITERIR